MYTSLSQTQKTSHQRLFKRKMLANTYLQFLTGAFSPQEPARTDVGHVTQPGSLRLELRKSPWQRPHALTTVLKSALLARCREKNPTFRCLMHAEVLFY